MKVVRFSTALVFCILLAGCHSLTPLLVPLSQGLRVTSSESSESATLGIEADADSQIEDDLCAPKDIDCALDNGTIVQLTALCEVPHSIPGGDDDCIGTYEYEAWILEPQSLVTAHHEGDGEFVVTLFRDDGTTEVLFEATGNYTSETIPLAPTGIVSMTVQSTGPWYVNFTRGELP